MNQPGTFCRYHLNPTAQEFFPTLPSLPPQILHPYPPPQHIAYAPPVQPVSLSPPVQPVPVSLPPSSTTPSRTLLLSMVPTTVSESSLRRELEVFGDVRAVQMERRREGVVTVHFYDLRDARAALMAIQEQHMHQQFRLGRHYDAVMNNFVAPHVPPPPPPPAARGLIEGKVVWAQFVTPVISGLVDGNNQGTLVVFNLEPGVSGFYLKQIFEAFGPVKELRETPNKSNQKFVEFYDVRNAAAAMAGMNGKEIHGTKIVIEYSRPGGQYCKKLLKSPQTQKEPSNSSKSNNYPSTRTNNYSPRSSNSSLSTPPPPIVRARGNYNSRGNPSGGSGSSSSGSSSFRGSLSNLGICGYDECSSSVHRPKKKNGSKKCNNSISDRPWKGGSIGSGGGTRHGKEHDPRFLINEDAIMESSNKDSRTTVMIKNIPNKYSQKLVLNMLDNHCIHCNEQIIANGGEDDQPLSSYDFLYLPIDFINKCNVGYGFVNMTSPEATLRLYKAFHHQNWEVFNSRKICEVTYARLQGLDALRDHFKNSKFPGDAEEYMPVVFSPPRDGRKLADPVPIVGGVLDTDTDNTPPSSASSPNENQSEHAHLEGVLEGVLNGDKDDENDE